MKFYIYKLTFKSGATYIGQHKVVRKNDKYVTSSSYYHNHPEDELVSRDIIIYTDTQDKANFLETFCIMSDKAYSKNNVNYNFGGLVFRFVGGTMTGKKMSRESKSLMSEKKKGKIQVYSDNDTRSCIFINSDELSKYIALGYKRGRKPPTEEAKRKMSETAKRNSLDPRRKEQLVSAASKGGHLSSGTKGMKFSEETRKKMSESRKGRKNNQGKKWYTNGEENRICFECPDGFHEGFTKPSASSFS